MLEREEIRLEKDEIESEINCRFLAEEVRRMGCVKVRESDGLMIFDVCCGSTIRRNSVLKGLRVWLLDNIQQDMRDTVDSKSDIAVRKFLGMKEMKS